MGEIATFINGRAYSQPELLSSGKYKVLRVGNFYTNDSWYYSDLELGEKYYANYGDLLYTWSATFGPHIWLGNKVIYHYHIWKVQLSDALEKTFALQLLEQDKAGILSNKNGSTLVHITKEGMEQKEVVIPSSIEEQSKIGRYFVKLDNLITLHQRKYTRLQSIKKELLSMTNIFFPDEQISVNDLFFLCYMIERVARKLHQKNKYVVNAISKDEWRRLISLANVLHCENPLKIEYDWIKEYHLEKGDFDITNVNPELVDEIPSETQIGKVYMRLILSTLQPGEDYIDGMVRVYNNEICDIIDNYNSSAYYEPSYVITRAYNNGGF